MKYLVLISLLFLQPAFAGNDGGSGGDTIGKEFEMLGRELHKTFQANAGHALLIKWKLKPSLFEHIINTTLLRTADSSEVVLDGYEVEAIHYQTKQLILINRDLFIQKTLLQKLELVLHEYLGMMGIEKKNYPVTNEFSDLIVQTYNRVKNSNAQNINLSYGYQKVINSINSSTICDQSSATYQDALELAKEDALARCSITRGSCRILLTEIKPVISSVMIGYKYCSVMAIAK